MIGWITKPSRAPRRVWAGNLQLLHNSCNHIIPLVSFYTPWKHQKTKPKASRCFQGVRRIPVAWNGLHGIFFTRMFKFLWASKSLWKQGFWTLNNSYIILLCWPKWASVFLRMKIYETEEKKHFLQYFL